MEARAHPRSSLQLKTELVCLNTQEHYQRYIRNISMGGLFVSGTPCGNTGMEVSLFVTPLNKPVEESKRFPARIIRTSNSGFALKFGDIGDSDNRILDMLTKPQWDGKNVFEGLLIAAAREHVMSLSECLRLTSVICNNYRRIRSVAACLDLRDPHKQTEAISHH